MFNCKKEEDDPMTERLLTHDDPDQYYTDNGINSTVSLTDLTNGLNNYGGFFPNDQESSIDPPTFDIRCEKFPTEVNKGQRRIGGKSQQRLRPDEAKVTLLVALHSIAQVQDVEVFVFRDFNPEYHTERQRLEPQKLKSDVATTDKFGEYRVSVDLDSVYDIEVPGEIKRQKIYALAKNKTRQANLFRLKVVVVYIDQFRRELNTDQAFVVIGKDKKLLSSTDITEPTGGVLPPPVGHGKRPRTDTDESNGSHGQNQTSGELPPPSNISAHSSSSGYSTDVSSFVNNDRMINASKIVAESIAAKQANIGTLIVARPIQVKGGDIAYQFILKNPDDHPTFEEGELAGLFVSDDGERVLGKLSQRNSVDAVLKGVISRSQWIEGNVQPEGVRVETICMFGIVPVRVRGPVISGDIVYASQDHPGTAVSSSVLGFTSTLLNDASAIGMSFKMVNCPQKEVNLIPCLVSITMEVFQGIMDKKIKHLKKDVDIEVSAIHKARKITQKKMTVCVSALATFVILLSVLMWQLFMPGTALRYYMCKIGCIPGHTSTFRFVPLSNTFVWSWVHGIEFEWQRIRSKTTALRGVKPIDIDGFHYYLNIDRCAYGQLSSTEDSIRGKKIVGGPHVFALNDTCGQAYFYHNTKGRWCMYKSAQNLNCVPARHHDHGHKPLNIRKGACL